MRKPAFVRQSIMRGLEHGLQRFQGIPRATFLEEYSSPGGRKLIKAGPLKIGCLN